MFSGQHQPATRVNDIKKLMLPAELEDTIKQTIYENRMLWEPWIESAENFQDLKKKMKERGYTNLPFHSPVMHRAMLPQVVTKLQKKIEPNIDKLPKPKSMLKKP